ncbi:MAG: DUF512 domain-containing protein [Firmicutes bacterium]|nr:DUF512 domain-containing protein [Bacillota bacterium]
MEQKIMGIVPGSIADELGIQPGDVLLAVSGQEIEDVLDYYFYTENEEVTLLIRSENGEEWEAEIEKDDKEELGLIFADQFMGTYQHCHNKCIFCFIDQLPKGMRDTLYFKDDDSRLSFLNGNYITMTNMKEKDIDRIIRYHMSPMNVSVHTTNPELRVMMLKNPRAKEIMTHLRRFVDAGIVFNGQIVLCKGVNDGAELERTLSDLSEFVPVMQSLSIVPVGLSCHREGLYPLEPFTKEDAQALIAQVEPWRQKFFQETGLHFVHLSDEFYILAGQEVPEEEAYDGYLQIENGVGMMRLFVNEAEEAIRALEPGTKGSGKVSLVTAPTPCGYIQRIVDAIMAKMDGGQVEVCCIRNDFFGERITVTGLLTGGDIINQLKDKDLGQLLLLPENLLKADEAILLDDVTVEDLKKALQIEIDIVQSSGKDFVHKIVKCLKRNELK